MVVPNTITGHKDILSLFWENKLGIDVDVCIFSLAKYAFIHISNVSYRTIIASLYLKGWGLSLEVAFS